MLAICPKMQLNDKRNACGASQYRFEIGVYILVLLVNWAYNADLTACVQITCIL
jgi:hypothetical protein